MHTNSGKKVFHAIMRRHCTSGRSSHSSLPEVVRFHECGAPMHAQVLSETLCFNLDSTVLRATDTLHCFNGLQQPHRPKEPEEPQRPQGWMLSFDSHHPIPQLSVNNLFLLLHLLLYARTIKKPCTETCTVMMSIPNCLMKGLFS